MKIYVASSWKNPWQMRVVEILRELGHDAYDFRSGPKFLWREVTDEVTMTPESYRRNLLLPLPQAAFHGDMDALVDAQACVMVLPCGSSAHLELGHAIGAGKRTAILFPTDIVVPPAGRLGHSLDEDVDCGKCGDLGCRLPGRVCNVDPELMQAAVGSILVNEVELRAWAKNLIQDLR